MKSNYKLGIILGIISIICSLLICGINYLVIGWIIGLIIGIIGIYMSNKNKNNYNIKLSNILCIIGIIFSLLNFIMGIITKYIH